MGFFGKIKQNIHHGGVQVQMQALENIHASDAELPVSVTLTAIDQPVTINSVNVRIDATSENMAFSQPSGPSNIQTNQQTIQTVAKQVNNQPFTLSPGQPQTLQLNISMSLSGTDAQNQIAGALATAAKTLSYLRNTSYIYNLVASADVEGIALDPSASQRIHIKGADEASGIQIKL